MKNLSCSLLCLLLASTLFAQKYPVTFMVSKNAEPLSGVALNVFSSYNKLDSCYTDSLGKCTLFLSKGSYTYTAGQDNKYVTKAENFKVANAAKVNVLFDDYVRLTFKAVGYEGRLIPQMHISIQNEATGSLAALQTDENGKAVLFAPAGSYRMVAQKEGYLKQACNISAKVNTSFTLPYGSHCPITISCKDAADKAMQNLPLFVKLLAYDDTQVCDIEYFKSVETDSNGATQLHLPRGKYSVYSTDGVSLRELLEVNEAGSVSYTVQPK